MRAFLLTLACLVHHANTQRDGIIDEDHTDRAMAELLLSINPSQSLKRHSARPGFRAPGSIMQYVGERQRAADIGYDSGYDMGGRRGEMLSTGVGTAPMLVQGGTLKTWSYASSAVERVQVSLSTEGRPLDADIELWQGPDNTPMKIRVYSEDGNYRPFNAVIETPSAPNTIAIRNIGQIEFPLAAFVIANDVDEPVTDFGRTSMTVQGGALRTFPFDPTVESVEVMLKTDGRPLNARIELLQGPNNNKQVIELYTEDGLDRPFFAILETIGSGNVIRLVNTGPVEFPMTATVQPHLIDENMGVAEAVIGGDGPLW